jgi:SAM-dependent methyltransferase
VSTPECATIKHRQQQAWATGDFAAIGAGQQIVGESLCEAVDLRAGRLVLDVACGAGNTALAAARRFAEVVGIDFVPALLERGRERAAAERLPVVFQEGDAEALPFPDATFDVVLSTFGVMFAPDQERAAAEVLRVCRPGGTIGLANWTPEGFTGQSSAIRNRYAPSPPGLAPPGRWGTEDGVRALLGQGVAEVRAERRVFVYRFPSPQAWLALMRTHFGPTVRTFAALDAAGQNAYATDLLALIDRFNRADDGTAVIPSEYLEVVATRS